VSDARAEDQDIVRGQPIKANRVGQCAAFPVCRDKILVGQDIVEVGGVWAHFEGTCADEVEAKLREVDAA